MRLTKKLDYLQSILFEYNFPSVNVQANNGFFCNNKLSLYFKLHISGRLFITTTTLNISNFYNINQFTISATWHQNFGSILLRMEIIFPIIAINVFHVGDNSLWLRRSFTSTTAPNQWCELCFGYYDRVKKTYPQFQSRFKIYITWRNLWIYSKWVI